MLHLFLLGGMAFAWDSEFAGTEKSGAPETEVDTELSVELGGMWTVGNTDSRTLSGKYDGAHRVGKNKFSARGGTLMGSTRVDSNSDGRLDSAERLVGRVETANRQEAWLRYDRYQGKRDSFYGLAGGFRDPYAGYNSRLNAQVGYSYQIVAPEEDEKTSLVGEFGFDAARENVVDASVPPDMILAARALLSLQIDIEETISVSEELESLVNVEAPEDSRVNSETALTAKISDILALKLSYRLQLDTQPVEGFARIDQTGLVTVVTSIF